MTDFNKDREAFLRFTHPAARPAVEHMISPYFKAREAGKSHREAMTLLRLVDNVPVEDAVYAAQSGAWEPGLVHRRVYDALDKYMADTGVREGVGPGKPAKPKADTGVREGIGPFFRGVIEPFKGLYNVPATLADAALQDPKYGLLKALVSTAISPITHGGSEFLGGIQDIRQGDVGQGLARAGLGAVEALSLPAMLVVPPVSPLAAGAAMGAAAAGLHGLEKYRETGEFPVSQTLGEATGGLALARAGASKPVRAMTYELTTPLAPGKAAKAGIRQETATKPPLRQAFEFAQKATQKRGSIWPLPEEVEAYQARMGVLTDMSQLMSGAEALNWKIRHKVPEAGIIGEGKAFKTVDPYTGRTYYIGGRTGTVFTELPEGVQSSGKTTANLRKSIISGADELMAWARATKEILWKRYEDLFLKPFKDVNVRKADRDAILQKLSNHQDIAPSEFDALKSIYENEKQPPFRTIGEAWRRLRMLNSELESYYRATREKTAVPSQMQFRTEVMRAEAEAIRDMLFGKAEELIRKYPDQIEAALSPQARAALPSTQALIEEVRSLPHRYGSAKEMFESLAPTGVHPGFEKVLPSGKVKFNRVRSDLRFYGSVPEAISGKFTVKLEDMYARRAGQALEAYPEIARATHFPVPVPSPGGPVGRGVGRAAAREVLSVPAQAGRYQIEKKQKEEE
jgi:hypothetical protein